MLIPRGLLAADPTRRTGPAGEVDVLVVGSGVAGLSTALAVSAGGGGGAGRTGRSVLLATKDRLGHSATRYAQGGIAAVLGGDGGRPGDSVAEHVADTLAAGAGLGDPAAVRMLVEEGGQAIAELLGGGVRFDRDPAAGVLARSREGGHSRSRVVHAGGDATGAELERALTEAVRAGAGGHPGGPPDPPRPLISEAMCGEGAVLRDGHGDPVMAGVHPLGDLAPRDVVTRAVAARMAPLGVTHLWLDATAIPAERLERRFPTILARCRAAGIEPTRQPIPVSPAAHYLMGGVVTDLDGRTNLPGPFAVGETACTGVHGANRLASNSLREGVVFAARIGRARADPGGVDNRAQLRPELGYAPPPGDPRPDGRVGARPGREAGAVRGRLRRLMTDRVGVVRSGAGLAEAAAELDRLPIRSPAGPDGCETADLVQLGRAMAELAARREESRGGHWRSDHPAPVEACQVRETLTRTAAGDLAAGLLPRPGPAPVPQPEAVAR